MTEYKTLVCRKPGELVYAVETISELATDHTLLKIKRIGICGTDLHAFGGSQPYFTYPRVLGHELAAEVVSSSDPEEFEAGELVTIMPYMNCGKCLACRSGKTNCCSIMQVFGVHRNGGMAEYLQVPTRLVIKGNGLNLDELALVEPLAIGAHGIRRAAVAQGEYVLVIGAGPIGLGAMEFAKISGAKVISMDTNAKRLDFCQQKLGIEYIINPIYDDVNGLLMDITGGDMPSVVIDATGNLNAINNGFQYMAHGGRYVLIGLQKGNISFSHPEFHKREATLMSSRNATIDDFNQVISAIKNKLIDPIPYITHRSSFNHVATDFQSWLDPENAVIKAMVSL
ncbi:alcohol dehydrogenase catalytic domain-containing protein [Pedobacter sp. LMG 31464]|uniref:Alcohol dehydrogenase catalytic domain-containing protein n=1 Tax=Pedobacter planticolens TaxID=2679964 RepID=A0A923IUU6_9SPHI|nr:zinc-binding alcohol dehydrogenase family protein [Pedobacter planticolens]MBB2145153.1 alcohol dehydrogenase catalytic domain-containing protein [Pedobacter planticolens]